MTLTPEQTSQLVYAIITLLGLLAVYIRQELIHTHTDAANQITNAKVDAQTAIINGQADRVTAAANALVASTAQVHSESATRLADALVSSLSNTPPKEGDKP